MTEETSGLSSSHIIDVEQLRLELYRLITMYLSASEIVGMGGPRWIDELESEFTAREVSRILIYTAIQGRICSDHPRVKSDPYWTNPCGELEEAVAPESVTIATSTDYRM